MSLASDILNVVLGHGLDQSGGGLQLAVPKVAGKRPGNGRSNPSRAWSKMGRTRNSISSGQVYGAERSTRNDQIRFVSATGGSEASAAQRPRVGGNVAAAGGGGDGGASGPSPVGSPPTVNSAMETDAAVGGGGSNTTSASSPIQSASLSAPGNLDIYLPARPITKTFRKRNLFFIDVSYNRTMPMPDTTGGFLETGAHIIPWRSPFMYMNISEYMSMQDVALKYRYKKCSFKFSNFSAHTGVLATGDAHINFQYNGVMGWSGLVSGQTVGPHYMYHKNGNERSDLNHYDVWSAFSNPQRDRGYRPYTNYLGLLPQIQDIVGCPPGGTDGANVTSRISFFDPMDAAFMEFGKLPISNFERTMTERRWRNGWKNTRMMGNVVDPNTYPMHSSEVMYGGAPFIMKAGNSVNRPSNGRYPNDNGWLDQPNSGNMMWHHTVIGMQEMLAQYSCDDIDPDVSAQPSAIGRSISEAGISGVTLRNPLDTFYFGFSVPSPTGQDPIVYMSFMLESELEVEIVPHFDSNNDWSNQQYLYNWGGGTDNVQVVGDGTPFIRQRMIRAADRDAGDVQTQGYINRIGYRQLQHTPMTTNSTAGGKPGTDPCGDYPAALHTNLNSGGVMDYNPSLPWNQPAQFGYTSFNNFG